MGGSQSRPSCLTMDRGQVSDPPLALPCNLEARDVLHLFITGWYVPCFSRSMALTYGEKQLVCSSVERFFRRLLEEDSSNADAAFMISLVLTLTKQLDQRPQVMKSVLLVRPA